MRAAWLATLGMGLGGSAWACGGRGTDGGDGSDDESCAAGSEGCACYGNGTCDEGLACGADMTCEQDTCPAGSEGCPCLPASACDAGLSCGAGEVCEADDDSDADSDSDSDADSDGDGDECSATDGAFDPACPGESPFCAAGQCVPCSATAEPDAACASAGDGGALCVDDVCVQCTADDTSACPANTGVCGAAGLCEPCTEHTDCLESACHLAGTHQGECFPASSVVYVDNLASNCGAANGSPALPYCTVSQAVNTLLREGGGVVIVKGGGPVYSGQVLVSGGEYAIIGVDNPLLRHTTLAASTVVVGGGGSLYLAGLQLDGHASGGGVLCDGATLWADAVRVVYNDGIGLNANACTVGLRRSTIGNNGGGGLVMAGGILDVTNSAISYNGDGSVTIYGGMSLNGVAIQRFAYNVVFRNASTIDGEASISCNNVTGAIRNSIITSVYSPSVDLDCDTVEFSGCALDTSDLVDEDDVFTSATSTHFVAPLDLNFRLSETAPLTWANLATLAEGDPATDIDGNPRPTLGYPGYHQP